MIPAGKRFREALRDESPLQIVGTINANHALLAKSAGFKAIYLSGGGVSAGSLGVPDLGILTLEDVLIDVRRITSVCDLPLLVDIDTGFGEAMNVSRTIETIESLGISGCHIEDQMNPKRCGHLDNKDLVSTQEMVKKIKAAVKAKKDPNFQIIARTDANAVEGLEKTIARAQAYVDAGADIVFQIGRAHV